MSKLVFSIFLIFAMITASPKKSLAIPLKPIFYQILENTVNDLSPNQSTNQETTTTQEIADSTNTYPSGEQTYPNQPIYQQYPPQQTYPNQPTYQQYPPQQTYPNQPIYQQYPPQQTYPNQPTYQQYPLQQTYPNQPIYQQYLPQQTYPNQPIYQQYPPQIYVIPMYPPQRSTTPVIINNF